MQKLNGMDMPTPSSGGGGIGEPVFGLVRQRSAVAQQMQLHALKSTIDVASSLTEHQGKIELNRDAFFDDVGRLNEVHPEGHPKAGQLVNPEANALVKRSGLERGSGSWVLGSSYVANKADFDEKKKAESAGSTTTNDDGSTLSKLGTSKKEKNKNTSPAEGATPIVNQTPVTPAAPSPVKRTPSASKGGFSQPKLPGMGKMGKAKKATGTNLGLGEMSNG